MQIDIVSVQLDHIRRLRDLYKRELDDISFYEADIRTHQCDVQLIRLGDKPAGYTILQGDARPRDRVVEFFLLPLYRQHTRAVFDAILNVTAVQHIVTKTSDTFLTLLLYDYADNITPSLIFFRDHVTTHALH